jgi:glycosyltransferase involved in cell wall biosynthesis
MSKIIAFVQFTNHYTNTKRLEFISNSLKDVVESKVILMYKGNDETLSFWIRKQFEFLIDVMKGKYSVVHVSGISWMTPQLIKLVSVRHCKYVYDSSNVHSEIMKTLKKNLFTIVLVKFLEILYIKGADYIVPCGVSFGNYFKKNFSRENNIILVPDPIDTEKYSNILERKRNGPVIIQQDVLVVAYTSTFDFITISGKGKLPRGWELVEMLTRLEEVNRNRIKIYLIGKGPSINLLKDLVFKRNLCDRFIFTGFLNDEEFKEIMITAQVGFMEDYSTLGYKYSVGSKIQEYMSAGLAIITGDSPEKKYMLCNQKIQELLFKPLDPEVKNGMEDYIKAIMSSFEFALNNVEKLKEAGEKNRKRASSIFGYETVNKLVHGLYRKVLK